MDLKTNTIIGFQALARMKTEAFERIGCYIGDIG